MSREVLIGNCSVDSSERRDVSRLLVLLPDQFTQVWQIRDFKQSRTEKFRHFVERIIRLHNFLEQRVHLQRVRHLPGQSHCIEARP